MRLHATPRTKPNTPDLVADGLESTVISGVRIATMVFLLRDWQYSRRLQLDDGTCSVNSEVTVVDGDFFVHDHRGRCTPKV